MAKAYRPNGQADNDLGETVEWPCLTSQAGTPPRAFHAEIFSDAIYICLPIRAIDLR